MDLAKVMRALKAMVEETNGISPMPVGLGLARYQALTAVAEIEGHAAAARLTPPRPFAAAEPRN
jgi:hypothetical protein